MFSLSACKKEEPIDGIYIGEAETDELMIGDSAFVVKAYKIDDAKHFWIENGKIKGSE